MRVSVGTAQPPKRFKPQQLHITVETLEEQLLLKALFDERNQRIRFKDILPPEQWSRMKGMMVALAHAVRSMGNDQD